MSVRYALLRPTGGFGDSDVDVASSAAAMTTAVDTSEVAAATNQFTVTQLFFTSVAAGVTVGLIMKYIFGRI